MPTGIRAQAFVIAVIWGVCFVVIERSLPTPAPILLAALRALVGGAVVMLAVAGRRWVVGHPGGQGDPAGPVPGLPRPGLPFLVVLAVTNVSVAFGAMYLAAGRTDAGVATILGGTQPLFLAAAGVWLLGERLSWRTVVASAVAMAGLMLVATAGSGTTGVEGVILAVTAAAAPAVGTVLVRRSGEQIDLLSTTAITLGLGGLILLGASAVAEPWSSVTWPIETLGSLLFRGVVGTGLAYVVWFRIAARVPAGALGSTLFIVPVAGMVASVLDGARLPAAALAGAVLMLAGVVVASR